MGSLKKVVKKIAKPEIILPIALLAATGGLGGIAGAGKAKLLGTAAKGASAAAAPGSLMGSGMAAATFAPGSAAATTGLLGTGGKLALGKGTLGKGIMYGLKNPLTKKGLATYGTGAGLLGLMMGKDKTEAQKNLNTDPQAVYDMGRLMNKQMGGAYTDEELNTYMAPLLSQYGGKYQIADSAPERKRRMMYPGLNYSGLTRYAADGGAIVGDDELSQQLYDEMQREQEIEEALFRLKMGQSMSEEPIIMGPETYNTGRAKGGRIGLANGGNLKFAVESFIRDFPEFENLELKELYKEMEKKGYLSDRDEMKDGGIMQLASAPDPMAERMDMMENLALDKFGKPLDRLSNDEVIQIEEMIYDMMPMAMGGSVPQTGSIPQGMQIDGRGGGFIPMGAKEKHDDVPAMLAKNEFVMTSDAVKAAGGGSVNKGAQAMYDLMHSLESKV